MRTFKEARGDTAVFTFGRFNPPTTGHEKLIEALAREQGKNPGSLMYVYPSHSQNAKKDPLPHAKKVAYMKKMFPRYKKNIIVSRARNIFEVATELHNKGHKAVVMVVGSDRVDEFDNLLNKYNGEEGRHGFYGFDNIEVVSAGERDPDAEGVTGMSASKMRAAASQNDYDSFKEGLPKGFTDGEKLFKDVRKNMGIREGNTFTTEEIHRDLYVRGEIWNVGDVVKTTDGDEGTIIRRGTNYVVFEDLRRVWLHNLEEIRDGLRRQKQDKDVEDRKGTQPAKYYAKDAEGDKMKKSTKQSRARHFERGAKMDDDNPAAYKPAPGDKGAKTKPSKYTKKFKQMYGERKLTDAEKNKLKKYEKDIDIKDFIDRYGEKEGKAIYYATLTKMAKKEGLWDNIRKKKERIARGSGERMRKPGEKGAPTPDQIKRAQGEENLKLDERSIFKDIRDKIYNMTHPKEMDRLIKAYVDAVTSDTRRRHGGSFHAGEVIRKVGGVRTGVDVRQFIDYINDLIRKGVLPRELMAQYDIAEETKHEITVGNYTTKYFYMCGSAQKVMSRLAGQNGAEEITRMQDEFYKLEKEVMDAGEASPEQIKQAKSLYNKIMQRAGTYGFADDIDGFMKDHIDSIEKGKPKPGFGRTDLKEEIQLDEKIAGIVKKSEKSGVPYGILKKVYDRGMAAWRTGHRPGTTPQQWAFARINSFLTGGGARKADADLWSKAKGAKKKKESYEIGQDYANHTYEIDPYSAPKKKATKESIQEWYENEEVHDKYRERYGERWIVKLTETYDKMMEKVPCCEECEDLFDHVIMEAEYQGKKVKLNDPIRTSENPNKKFKVYVKNEKGKVVVVRFGDPNMAINRDDPERRKSFRARHNCDDPGPKTKARYWSCFQWRAGAKVDN